ncbi:MAG: type II toxin-antitoxin system ParD family antitoxin, partial [Vicinamibacterales bacterium]
RRALWQNETTAMPKTSSLTITLPEALEAFVRQRVADGRYLTSSEVVEDALVLLEAREREREAVLAEIRHEIELGVAQADAGELIDGETVFAKLLQRRRARTDSGLR